jgi:hypothetical protein
VLLFSSKQQKYLRNERYERSLLRLFLINKKYLRNERYERSLLRLFLIITLFEAL